MPLFRLTVNSLQECYLFLKVVKWICNTYCHFLLVLYHAWSLASRKGSLAKSTKSKLLPLLEELVNPIETFTTVDIATATIVDGMALQSPGPAFQDVVDVALSRVLKTHPAASHIYTSSRIDFVVDTYPSISTKVYEMAACSTAGTVKISIVNSLVLNNGKISFRRKQVRACRVFGTDVEQQ